MNPWLLTKIVFTLSNRPLTRKKFRFPNDTPSPTSNSFNSVQKNKWTAFITAQYFPRGKHYYLYKKCWVTKSNWHFPMLKFHQYRYCDTAIERWYRHLSPFPLKNKLLGYAEKLLLHLTRRWSTKFWRPQFRVT